MLNTVWAVVREGRIKTIDEVDAPEGTRALVTMLVEDEADFWQAAASLSLDEILAQVTPENLHGEIDTGQCLKP